MGLFKRSWREWAEVVGLALVLAVVLTLGYAQWRAWQGYQDALRQVVGVVNYNLQQGRLALPTAAPAASVAPAGPVPAPAATQGPKD